MRITLCVNYDDWVDRGRPAGAIFYYEQEGGPSPAGVSISCPCGCGGLWGATFPRWNWNGNREAPTLSPSLRFLEGCREATHWHGFIQAGEFVTCDDTPNRPAT